MTRYKLPEVLGGGEFEATSSIASDIDPARDRVGLDVPGVGRVVVPTVALTPVDTTPAEPEPGAWDLDGIIAVCVEVDDWRIPSREQPGPEGWAIYRFTWRTVWEKLGGPGITPRRLVPEPEPVELPWEWTDTTTGAGRVAVGVIQPFRVKDNGTWIHADCAEAKGWALISAARAAREVKP